jgi:F0F1-type ATP synthase, delta subunit (mitochondrial oligomycin sensitivity protein)
MKNTKTALRYAKSLHSFAQEKNELDKVYADMKLVSETFVASADLQTLVKNPIVKEDEKKKVFGALFAENCTKISTDLLNLMIDNNRANLVGEVADQFIALHKKSQKHCKWPKLLQLLHLAKMKKENHCTTKPRW